MQNVKGWKTYAVSFFWAMLPVAVDNLYKIPWDQLVSAKTAVFISAGLMVLMRTITNSGPGQKS